MFAEFKGAKPVIIGSLKQVEFKKASDMIKKD